MTAGNVSCPFLSLPFKTFLLERGKEVHILSHFVILLLFLEAVASREALVYRFLHGCCQKTWACALNLMYPFKSSEICCACTWHHCTTLALAMAATAKCWRAVKCLKILNKHPGLSHFAQQKVLSGKEDICCASQPHTNRLILFNSFLQHLLFLKERSHGL